MKSVIEELRSLHNVTGMVGDDIFEVLDLILEPWGEPKGYIVERVHEDYEDGGRWTDTRIHVYKVEENGEVAYFELWREVPATELQEGMDFSYGFYEVEPKEVTVIQYARKEDVR